MEPWRIAAGTAAKCHVPSDRREAFVTADESIRGLCW